MGFTMFNKPHSNKCRHFLDKDDDGQWYLVNANYRKEWSDFKSSKTDIVPLFAKILNYNVSDVEFSNPVLKSLLSV